MKSYEEVMRYRFNPQPIAPEEVEFINSVREAFQEISTFLAESLPDGRCKSKCLTEIESASMWAVKSISHDTPKKEEE